MARQGFPPVVYAPSPAIAQREQERGEPKNPILNRCWEVFSELRPANSVHGLGMLAALEVALVDTELRVRHVLRLRPFGLTRPQRGVTSVLQAPVGPLREWGLTVGSQLTVATREVAV